MHKLKKTLAAICLLTPVAATAVGVGEINLQSALNQNLRAEIPLISSGAEDASNVRISLASASAFAKAGIERFYFLNSLQFKPIVKADGNLVVEVTSSEVIREPFLNFLVEVQWPNGRMLREFTVLLDPPSMMAKTTAPVQASTPVAKKSVETVATPPSVSVVAKPVEPTVNIGSVQVAEKAVVDVQPERSDMAAVNVSPAPGGDEYGPVAKRDSIWNIAKRINPDPRVISHEQMMMALYRHNPQAFYRKNVSALKAGAVLVVPGQDAIMDISRKDARVSFAKQSESWMGQSGKVASKSKPVSQSTSKVSKVDNSKAGKTAHQLELLSAAKNPVTGKVDLQQNSALLAEAQETLTQENEELRSRVVDLEKQVKTVERLLALKDEQLASLQGRLKEAASSVAKGAEQIASSVPEVVPNVVDDAAKIASEVAKASNEIDVTVPAEIPSVEDVKPEESEVLVSPAGEDINAEAISENATPEANVETEQQTNVTPSEPVLTPVDPIVSPIESVVKPVVPDVEQESPVQVTTNDGIEEQGLIAEFLSEPLYPAAAGIGVILLGLFAFALSRRKAGEDEDQADIITAPENLSDSLLEEDELLAQEIDQASSDDFGQSNLEEETFLSEFSASDLSTMDADAAEEQDPISEADVYLAYGRHQQAEDLIQAALTKEPSNEEYKLKLLEIYAAADNQEGFDRYTKELHESSPGSEFWGKVTAVGAAFSPHNPLFGGEADETVGDSTAVSDIDLVSDIDISSEIDVSSGVDDVQELLGAGEDASIQVEGDDAFEFDLTEAYGDLSTTDLEAQPAEEGENQNFDDMLDVSLVNDLAADESGSEIDSDTTSADDLDFDMTFLNEGKQQGIDATESSLSSLSPASEVIDFDLDALNMPVDESEISTLGEVSDEFPELTDMDEVETKLDLAKAYVDMEDKESAREILDDVLGKGSDAQKQEAEQLIKKLASN